MGHSDSPLLRRRTSGARALHLAVDSAHPDALGALLSAGADAESARHDGHTPLTLACMHGYDDVLALLVSHGVAIDRHITLTADPADGAARRRRKVPLSPSKRSSTVKLTPLMVAAQHGAAAAVQDLLDAGASPLAESHPDGQTALEIARDAVARGVHGATAARKALEPASQQRSRKTTRMGGKRVSL